MGRGRPPKGADLVDSLEGEQEAKTRLKVVLSTIAGEITVKEACEQLGVCESRFHQIRRDALQSCIRDLESKPLGRPTNAPTEEQKRIAELEEQIMEYKMDLYAARVRAKLAAALPHLLHEPDRPAKKKRRKWKKPR